MSCSQLVEIEDLVLGTIEPARARELRVHLVTCTACRREQAAVSEERALFTQREAALGAPPEAIAVALRAQLAAEVAIEALAPRPATRLVRRGASALGRVLRRGHVSAACAALLFALVAFSKPGGAPLLRAAEPAGASREPSSGPAASLVSQSLGDETLACSVGVAMTSFSDDTLVSSGATAQASSSGATLREVLVCGRRGEGSVASCQPSVTCSSLRQ